MCCLSAQSALQYVIAIGDQLTVQVVVYVAANDDYDDVKFVFVVCYERSVLDCINCCDTAAASYSTVIASSFSINRKTESKLQQPVVTLPLEF